MVEVRQTKMIEPKVVAAFGEQAKKEWNLIRGYRSVFYLSTHKIWVLSINDKPMCVIAFKRTSLIGSGAELVFMLCKGFALYGKQVLLFIARALKRIRRFYKLLTVRVEDGFWIGEKFVQFFGFVAVPGKTEIGGKEYNLYELRTA